MNTKNKLVLLNFSVFALYSLVFFAKGYKSSGGDIFFISLTQICGVLHLFILLILALYHKRANYYGMVGVLSGMLLTVFLFYLL